MPSAIGSSSARRGPLFRPGLHQKGKERPAELVEGLRLAWRKRLQVHGQEREERLRNSKRPGQLRYSRHRWNSMARLDQAHVACAELRMLCHFVLPPSPEGSTHPKGSPVVHGSPQSSIKKIRVNLARAPISHRLLAATTPNFFDVHFRKLGNSPEDAALSSIGLPVAPSPKGSRGAIELLARGRAQGLPPRDLLDESKRAAEFSGKTIVTHMSLLSGLVAPADGKPTRLEALEPFRLTRPSPLPISINDRYAPRGDRIPACMQIPQGIPHDYGDLHRGNQSLRSARLNAADWCSPGTPRPEWVDYDRLSVFKELGPFCEPLRI